MKPASSTDVVPLSRGANRPEIGQPTVGALTRLVWLAFRERIYAAVQEAGYTDLQPTHVRLFRYPTLANLRPKELADEVGISKQAVNDLLRQLESKGYVELRPDPSDGRARLITLTERGAELMDFVRAAANEISEEWARSVGRKRYDALHHTLAELLENSRGGGPPREL
jgi:DNA-binding MarR family transcriptional regulator